MDDTQLSLKGVKVNNLKNVSLDLPAGQLIVFSGVSGSGKSSMAFETIYAAGQNAYIDSLSHHPKVPLLPRPDVDEVRGTNPTIAIEQKSGGRNPRSTVATMTQIHDFLRLLYARVAIPHCPISGEAVQPRSLEQIITAVRQLKPHGLWSVLATISEGTRAEFVQTFKDLLKQGFLKARLDGQWIDLEDPPRVDKEQIHTLQVLVDTIEVDGSPSLRISEAITQALELGHGTCFLVDQQEKEEHLFSIHAYSRSSGLSYPALQPYDFSYNHPQGMCPTCLGLGVTKDFDIARIVNPKRSIDEHAFLIRTSSDHELWRLERLPPSLNVRRNVSWEKLTEREKNTFLYGVEGIWPGVLPPLRQYLAFASGSEKRMLDEFRTQMSCPQCRGHRLRAYPAAATFSGATIYSLLQMPLEDAKAFLQQVQLDPEEWTIAQGLLQQILLRLDFLIDVGLEYLTLDRNAPSLSGGEAQRVRLACQIGSGLVGATYVLDEPSIGLHPSDNKRLLKALRHLSDLGNRVIVVEHDEETILAADHIVDFGPLAGQEGGEILYSGPIKNFLKCKHSLTADYLTKKRHVWNKKPRSIGKEHPWLSLKGATLNNLQDVTLNIPLERFVVITGPSGSGKSSLISETLYPILAKELNGAEERPGPYTSIEGIQSLDKVILIDQSPLGRMSRSIPATYTKLFDAIRDLFAGLPESQARGYDKGRFSFNAKSGACPHCAGIGQIRIELDANEEGWLPCNVCEGRRFDTQTLSIKFRGKNVYDVLEMTVKEACAFFEAHPSIARVLQAMMDAGLGYMRLGEPSVHLSGGEAQRVKLAKELARPHRQPCLYVLDEPTTGLHFHDIAQLLHTLHLLVDQGHTIVVIEHNLDLIKSADWVIDLGPKGGRSGGKIVASGTVETLFQANTLTGESLRAESALKPNVQKVATSLREIEIVNAQQHNLKGVSLAIPRNALTVITGPSGSGKSSLAFDTLFAEGQRRYSEALSPYVRQFIEKLPPPIVDRISGLSPAVAIEQRARANNPRSTVGTLTHILEDLRVIYAQLGQPHCPLTGEPISWMGYEEIAKQLLQLPPKSILALVTPILAVTTTEWEEALQGWQKKGFLKIMRGSELLEIDDRPPFSRTPSYLLVDRMPLPKAIDRRLVESLEMAHQLGNGTIHLFVDDKLRRYKVGYAASDGKTYPALTPQVLSYHHPDGVCPACMATNPRCAECKGSFLNPFARHVLWQGMPIHALCALSLQDISRRLDAVGPVNNKYAQERLERICHRLRFACQVGLYYLGLDRTAGTLSSGEAQRIRLARQLGSGLTGVLYVIDEPSIGLHPHESHLLNKTLQELKELNNTVIVVEHDPLIIEKADHVIEMGPGAGIYGGQVLFQGSIAATKKSKSLTGRELRGEFATAFREVSRSVQGGIHIKNAKTHNLKDITCTIPYGHLTCITGRSGSGKSTLLEDLIFAASQGYHPNVSGLEHFAQVQLLTQAPLGANIRADVATYTDMLTPLRQIFSQLPLAQARGLQGMHFSYNHPAGMCSRCDGLGYRIVDMQFLPSIHIPCPECQGLRLKQRSLDVTYRGYNIGQLLSLSLKEFAPIFSHVRKIHKALEILFSVGLDYLHLGQGLLTLSGGESQRLRLSTELMKRTRGPTLYLFDEPTTGLHILEVHKLINILHQLVDAGHTVIVIEHHLDFIRSADHVVDLGPGSGPEGGHLIYSGLPSDLKNCRSSVTGRYL